MAVSLPRQGGLVLTSSGNPEVWVSNWRTVIDSLAIPVNSGM